MLKIQDIMTREVICVHKDTPIVEAIEAMVDNDITGVPVVEENGILVGVLSEKDVLRLFHTHKQERDRIAGEFMTEQPVSFEEDEYLLDVCYRLRDCPIRRVPVTRDGKITGIISRSDVLKLILQSLRETCRMSSG